MEVYHQYVKLRKQFGRHPKFNDEGAEMLADIRPNEEHAQVGFEAPLDRISIKSQFKIAFLLHVPTNIGSSEFPPRRCFLPVKGSDD